MSGFMRIYLMVLVVSRLGWQGRLTCKTLPEVGPEVGPMPVR